MGQVPGSGTEYATFAAVRGDSHGACGSKPHSRFPVENGSLGQFERRARHARSAGCFVVRGGPSAPHAASFRQPSTTFMKSENPASRRGSSLLGTCKHHSDMRQAQRSRLRLDAAVGLLIGYQPRLEPDRLPDAFGTPSGIVVPSGTYAAINCGTASSSRLILRRRRPSAS